ILVDLVQWTEPLQVVPHTVVQHVRRISRALDQLVGRLGVHGEWSKRGETSSKRKAFHAVPPLGDLWRIVMRCYLRNKRRVNQTTLVKSKRKDFRRRVFAKRSDLHFRGCGAT